ncbi:MAG: hypothetical protein WC516_04600 [Patescibacteria group bacterium]|jgi:hypothetical protein
MTICKGGPNCGWAGHVYNCYCNNSEIDRILKIKKVIEEVREFYKNEYFPITAWESFYEPFISAIDEIEAICYGRETNMLDKGKFDCYRIYI